MYECERSEKNKKEGNKKVNKRNKRGKKEGRNKVQEKGRMRSTDSYPSRFRQIIKDKIKIKM